MHLAEHLMKKYDLTNRSTIAKLCEEYGAMPTKRFGQNFIVNPGLCPKIVDYSGITSKHGVLEIGTGIGTLTEHLCDASSKVVSLEIDHRLEPIHQETLAHCDNLTVKFCDAMKTDIPALIKEEFGDMPVAVVANLPYYITSPVIMMLLEKPAGFESITVMVQKEAADRLCANVGTRESGAVTVAVNYYTVTEKLFDVQAGSFFPPPKVASSVIRLMPQNPLPYPVVDEKLFFRIVRAGFEQRRKTLVNALNASFSHGKENLTKLIVEVTDNPNVRAEKVTMEQWQKLCEKMASIKQQG